MKSWLKVLNNEMYEGRPMILDLAISADSSGTRTRTLSTAATISLVGICVGAGAKFSPFLRAACWASDSGLEDRFTTHLGWVSENLMAASLRTV